MNTRVWIQVQQQLSTSLVHIVTMVTAYPICVSMLMVDSVVYSYHSNNCLHLCFVKLHNNTVTKDVTAVTVFVTIVTLFVSVWYCYHGNRSCLLCQGYRCCVPLPCSHGYSCHHLWYRGYTCLLCDIASFVTMVTARLYSNCICPSSQ